MPRYARRARVAVISSRVRLVPALQNSVPHSVWLPQPSLCLCRLLGPGASAHPRSPLPAVPVRHQHHRCHLFHPMRTRIALGQASHRAARDGVSVCGRVLVCVAHQDASMRRSSRPTTSSKKPVKRALESASGLDPPKKAKEKQAKEVPIPEIVDSVVQLTEEASRGAPNGKSKARASPPSGAGSVVDDWEDCDPVRASIAHPHAWPIPWPNLLPAPHPQRRSAPAPPASQRSRPITANAIHAIAAATLRAAHLPPPRLVASLRAQDTSDDEYRVSDGAADDDDDDDDDDNDYEYDEEDEGEADGGDAEGEALDTEPVHEATETQVHTLALPRHPESAATPHHGGA